MAAKKMNFETALEKLEEIVREMEGGELPLESALEKFEEGMDLSRFLNEKLDEVQKKVSILVSDNQGDMVSEDFKGPGEEE